MNAVSAPACEERNDAGGAHHPETRERNLPLLPHLRLRQIELLADEKREVACERRRYLADRPFVQVIRLMRRHRNPLQDARPGVATGCPPTETPS